MRILICGLPGSGKTTLAKCLTSRLDNCTWFNADEVRAEYNDWDFSDSGRLRQAKRMKSLSLNATTKYSICDFVAPTEELRKEFDADYIIWVDTINESRFKDTNNLFIFPNIYNIRVMTKDASMWAELIITDIKNYIQL